MEDLLGRDLLYEVSKIQLDLSVKASWITGQYFNDYLPKILREVTVERFDK